ncbi:MAG: toxin-antitoxin system protein [Tannerella sp.]|jgi:hypothetical protein|nr:toxin-antitoxin system protein [Tannerella sp.]
MSTETLVNRKQTAFRLREDLLNRMRTAAKKENRSLNNYVENTLMDIFYRKPNKETLEAIKEAMEGKNLETLNMDNFDAFVASL